MNSIPERPFRDRDHLLTKDGLYFTVVGNVHPSDRIVAYLKYYPHIDQDKVRKTLKRAIKHYNIPNIIKTIKILEDRYPHYMFFLEPYGFKFSAVPLECLKESFLPEKKLQEMLQDEELDTLSQRAINLALRLSQECKLSIEKFGITGSILLGIHDPVFSDIDLTIYGKDNSKKVKNVLLEIFKTKDLEIKRADGEFLSKIKKQFQNMNDKELKIFYQRKWNRGTFKGKFFSINPVRTENEVSEKYGEKKYIPLGIVETKAYVKDSSENLFIPAVYKIEEVKIVKGLKVLDIEEVVSYDRNYADVAETGERILCRGKLEKVIVQKDKCSYHRVAIGSLEASGDDFIKIY